MMKALLEDIDLLIEKGIPHRKGHKLAECSLQFIAEQMAKEAFECQTAATLYEVVKKLELPQEVGGVGGLAENMRTEIKKELGDTIAIVFHLMRALEMKPEELEEVALMKLYQRFTFTRGHQGDTPEKAIADVQLTKLEYVDGDFRTYFTTPFEQYREHVGKPFDVVQRLPDAEGCDGPETGGSLYKIRFKDGTEITAWGHEVCRLEYEKCA